MPSRPSEEHGDHRVDVSVGANERRRGMFHEPDKGGIADQRASQDQVGPGPPSFRGDLRQGKSTPFSKQVTGQEQENRACEHLDPCAGHRIGRMAHMADVHRADRPAQTSPDQGRDPGQVPLGLARLQERGSDQNA